jgi:hypothetical protein
VVRVPIRRPDAMGGLLLSSSSALLLLFAVVVGHDFCFAGCETVFGILPQACASSSIFLRSSSTLRTVFSARPSTTAGAADGID